MNEEPHHEKEDRDFHRELDEVKREVEDLKIRITRIEQESLMAKRRQIARNRELRRKIRR